MVPTRSCREAPWHEQVTAATGIGIGSANGVGSDVNSHSKNAKEIMHIPNKSNIALRIKSKNNVFRFQKCDAKDVCNPASVKKNDASTFIGCDEESINFSLSTVVHSFHCAKLDLGIPTTYMWAKMESASATARVLLDTRGKLWTEGRNVWLARVVKLWYEMECSDTNHRREKIRKVRDSWLNPKKLQLILPFGTFRPLSRNFEHYQPIESSRAT